MQKFSHEEMYMYLVPMTFSSCVSNFECVGEFHRVFEHPIKNSPDVSVFEENPKLVSLRYALIEEETKEFIEAAKTKDVVEMVDALADIEYVVFGAGHAFGINMDSMLSLACLPAARKLTPSDYFSRTSEAKVTTICEEFQALLSGLEASLESRNMIEIAVVLLKIVEQAYSVAADIGVDLDEAFDLVHKSNMTKACLNREQAEASLEQYLKDTSVYKDPAIKQSADGKYWIVYDRSTGKTLKSKFYKAVNLRQLVE